MIFRSLNFDERTRPRLRSIATVLLALTMTACAPLEQTARDAIAGAKGVLLTAQVEYGQECHDNPSNKNCALIHGAVAAQNTAIDALVVYCSGKANPDGTGACAPDKTKAPKLQTAISNLDTIIRDVKGIVR